MNKFFYGTFLFMATAYLIVTAVFGVHFSNIIEKEKTSFEKFVLNETNDEKMGDTKDHEKINDNNIKLSVQFISSILTIFGISMAFFSLSDMYSQRLSDERVRKEKEAEQNKNFNEIVSKLNLQEELIKTLLVANVKLVENEGLKHKLYIPDNLHQLSVELKEAIKHSKINQNN
ncbi:MULTISPECIES: hypothetical protein [Cytobacillus]|uniref:hypothetical protein n=1 Tax=Cytobacillus TaxID=2675230 RepID=UPI002079C346|nr:MULTISPECIES: hypothetical protein [Cytobacillus]MED3576106.1 hypothetical protein [Cytobacillus praedii]USK57834.1 hypothetical protein LIS82_26820 [Cytobacillus solani]